jgi:hypothetical protein
MRHLACAVLVLGLGLSLVHGDDAADARAIIDKAIKAGGGADALAKLKSESFREKGTYYGLGDGLPYTGIYSVQWPERFHMEIEGVLTMVVAGDKGWVKTEKGVQAMTDAELAREKNNLHGGYVSTLIPLKEKGYTLSTLPEAKVNDKAVVGVKVAYKDRPDVTLWFDKSTGLLAKAEQMVQAEDPKEKKEKMVKQETTFDDYKDFSGYKVATKVVAKREGKLFVEATLSDVKPVEKFEDKVFAKPE